MRMSRTGDQPPPELPPVTPEAREKPSYERLMELFAAAEAVFGEHGRELTKPHLILIDTELKELNKSPAIVGWNHLGELTEEQYRAIDRRWKKLSNAVGILTADGTIRHNLNVIPEE